jgi:transcriptional antiterminator NusG
MNMQHRFNGFDGKVSMKGMMQLSKLADAQAIRAREVAAASKRLADESPKKAVWICLHVDSGRELTVEKLLDDAKIDAVVAMRKGPVLRRRHKELPPQDLPVLNGYVPVRCISTPEAMRGLKGFDYVRGVVGGWDNPRCVAIQEMTSFNEKAARGEYDFKRPAGLFRRGQKVEVTEGPFHFLQGEIISCRADGCGDAVVEIVLLGRTVPVLLPLALLRRV